MHLYYSLYNHSNLDNTTEWDLSGKSKNGAKTGFPNSLVRTPVTTKGPPASYNHTGASKIVVNYGSAISKPFSISFWVKVGTLTTSATIFRTNTNTDFKIVINKDNRRLIIAGENTDVYISNDKFDFITIDVNNNSILVSKNAILVSTLTVNKAISNYIFTMLENFVGYIGDFIIHNGILTKEKENIFYKSALLINKNKKAYIPYIQECNGRARNDASYRNTLGKNKQYSLEKINEFFPASGFNKQLYIGDLNFTVKNINVIEPVTGLKKTTPLVVDSKVVTRDSLMYFKITINSSIKLTDVELTAESISGSVYTVLQKRNYATISANTPFNVFIVFKTVEKNLDRFSLKFQTGVQPTFSLTNPVLVNLTHAGIENLLADKNIYPVYSASGNTYDCSGAILTWVENNLKNKVFSGNTYTFTVPQSENDLKKLNDANKKMGFVKLWNTGGLLAEEVNEYIKV